MDVATLPEPPVSGPESLEDMLRRLEAEALKAQDVVCGHSIENLAVCVRPIENECPLQGRPTCPRVQLRLQRRQRNEARAIAARRGVPERALVKAWDQPPLETPAIKTVTAWMPTGRSILVLSGTNQCGKTIASGWACCPHEEWGGEKRFTRYVTAAEATGPAFDSLFAALKSHLELVVIDDLGQAYFGASGFTLSRLEVLVDAVYQRNKRLILCSDIKLMDGDRMPLFDLLGKRITSRIAQSGRVEANLGPAFQEGR